MESTIKAKLVNIEKGLQEYDNVEMVRVKSVDHTLLILQNYMPLLGRLDGYVELVFENRTLRFNDLRGYYMHKKNVFSLLVQEGELIPEDVIEEASDVR